MTKKERDEAEKELTGDGLGDAVSPEGPGEPTASDEGAQDERSRSQVEMADLSNRLLRTQADFENYRRRTAKEREDLIAYANQRLLISFLPVLDNLDRALSAPKVEGDEKLRQGVELTARSFREILSKEGVIAIEAVGTPFDPNLHEAVMTVESDEHEDGLVVAEFQKGYKLADRIIRPSMVQVSKKG